MEGDLVESEPQVLKTGVESITAIVLEHCEPSHSRDLIIPNGFNAEDIQLATASKQSIENKRKKKIWDVPLRHNLPRQAKNRAILLITGFIHGVKIKRELQLAIPKRQKMRKVKKIKNKIKKKIKEKVFSKNLVKAKKIQTRRVRVPQLPHSSDSSSYSSYS